VRAARGLPPLGDLRRVLTDGSWVLHPDVPELVPTGGLPPEHLFLGPVLWQPHVPLPPGWPAHEGSAVVYLTLGSSGPSHLLSQMVSELARLPIRLLVATAGRTRVGPVPANVLVADYLPGDAAVELASVVVTNGGSSSGYQALVGGRPVVGVPWNLDQLLATQAIESVGAGSSVRASRSGVRQLASRVEAALGGAHASGVRRAQTALARLDAPSRFREWIHHAFAPPRPVTRS
jgi:UDP:flavonoid glycosyltransferase YjiC (YdhE family)